MVKRKIAVAAALLLMVEWIPSEAYAFGRSMTVSPDPETSPYQLFQAFGPSPVDGPSHPKCY